MKGVEDDHIKGVSVRVSSPRNQQRDIIRYLPNKKLNRWGRMIIRRLATLPKSSKGHVVKTTLSRNIFTDKTVQKRQGGSASSNGSSSRQKTETVGNTSLGEGKLMPQHCLIGETIIRTNSGEAGGPGASKPVPRKGQYLANQKYSSRGYTRLQRYAAKEA